MKISRSAINRVVLACLEVGAKQARIHLSPDLVVRATRRFKPDKRNCRTEILLTIGKPNYAERDFVKRCRKANVPFPIWKMQLKWYKLAAK